MVYKLLLMQLVILMSTYAHSEHFETYLNFIKLGPNSINYPNQCTKKKSQDLVVSGCKDLLPLFYEAREMLFSIHENPQKHGLNEFEDMESFDREVFRYQKITNDIANNCLEKEFRRCFPELNKTIEISILNKVFNDLKTDPVQRMVNPGSSCHERAQDLAIRLAEQGIDSKILMIKEAPTLIAPILDSADRYSGKFIDYSGAHYVILVKDSKGREYILDPQFSTRPMLKDEYFKSTMGQVCSSGKLESIWSCTYEIVNSTYNIPFTNDLRVQKSRASYEQNGDILEDFLKGEVGKISCGVFNRLTAKSVKTRYTESNSYKENPIIDNKTRVKIIVASYEKLYQDRIKHQQDPLFEQYLKQSFKDYEKQIRDYNTFIESICSEHEVSIEDCLSYRKNFENIVKDRNY